MIKLPQFDLQQFLDVSQKEEWSTSEANVQMVLWNRFRLIKNRVPKDIRDSLNKAVKEGRLGHLKKDGHKPECYFHPDFDYLARSARKKHEQSIISASIKFFRSR